MLQADEQDAELTALRNGDQQAFARLVKQYHSQMVVVARAIAGDTWAEEVTQEAWVSIHRALPKFEGRSTLKTWLFTIVKNQAKTRRSKESRLVSLDAAPLGDSSDSFAKDINDKFRGDGHWKEAPPHWHTESPAALLEEEQLQRCIHHTVEQLSPEQRAVFTMRDIQQMSLEQICNILEISNSNVRVLLHRARLKLMQVIDHYQETGTC